MSGGSQPHAGGIRLRRLFGGFFASDARTSGNLGNDKFVLLGKVKHNKISMIHEFRTAIQETFGPAPS